MLASQFLESFKGPAADPAGYTARGTVLADNCRAASRVARYTQLFLVFLVDYSLTNSVCNMDFEFRCDGRALLCLITLAREELVRFESRNSS